MILTLSKLCNNYQLAMTYSPLQREEVPFVLLSASVSDNLDNSTQMAAPGRSRERDQSTQRFHVGCDNRCLLGNKFGGLHGREFLGRTSLILILTNKAVFVTLSVLNVISVSEINIFNYFWVLYLLDIYLFLVRNAI